MVLLLRYLKQGYLIIVLGLNTFQALQEGACVNAAGAVGVIHPPCQKPWGVKGMGQVRGHPLALGWVRGAAPCSVSPSSAEGSWLPGTVLGTSCCAVEQSLSPSWLWAVLVRGRRETATGSWCCRSAAAGRNNPGAAGLHCWTAVSWGQTWPGSCQAERSTWGHDCITALLPETLWSRPRQLFGILEGKLFNKPILIWTPNMSCSGEVVSSKLCF